MKYLVALGFLLLAAPCVQAQSALPAATQMELSMTASVAPPATDEMMSKPVPLAALEADTRVRKARRQSSPEVPASRPDLKQRSRNAPAAQHEKNPETQAE